VGRRRRSILKTTVAAAALVGASAGRPALAQQGQPAAASRERPPATAPAPSLAPATRPAATRPTGPDVAGDLRSLDAILLQPDARQGDRDEAAARLVSRGTPQADEILRNVLMNGPRDGRLAVARALADDPTPSEAMITPLSDLMRLGAEQRPPTTADAAAQALANYRRVPEAVDELVRFSLDAAQPVDARARVVRALGRVVDPAAADLLVRLVRTERGALRTAAADALADLTGIRENGQDANRWAQWQRNSVALAADNVDRWRAELLEARATNLDRLRRRQDALLESLNARMLAQYQEAARQQRGSDVLLSFLNSDQPDERWLAARLVTRAFTTDPVSERVRERLVALVGDSDPKVRHEVAVTLGNLNHRPALAAELTQLAQESEDPVKVALCDALGRIGDPVAAPQLAALLSDSSPAVFTAAAGALSRVGQDLRGAADGLPPAALESLRRMARSRGASDAVRIAAIDALGVLRDPQFVDLAQRLLSGPQADPSVDVRQATLRGLASLGDPAAAELITRALREETREPAMRRAALDALGRVGNLPEHGTLLLDYTSPRNESDESVRQRAWEAYQALLPRASPAQLTAEQNSLKNDPVRRAVVLEELCRKLEQSPAPQDKANLAANRENLGDAYIARRPPEPAKAAPHLRRALDYFVANGANENVTTPLSQKVIDAYLKAKDYAQAARFAEQVMSREPAQIAEMGRAIKQEADRLRSPTVNDARAAQQLIDEALKMNPPLEERHVNDLRQIRQEIGAAQ
jgi:HEAT repeat protein